MTIYYIQYKDKSIGDSWIDFCFKSDKYMHEVIDDCREMVGDGPLCVYNTSYWY